MDRRAVFFFVFVFTLLSTVVVTVVGVATGQKALHVVLYSTATMWIVGIVSQVLATNLFQGIVRPIEEKQERARELAARREVNLEEVEAIDEAVDRLEAHKVSSGQPQVADVQRAEAERQEATFTP